MLWYVLCLIKELAIAIFMLALLMAIIVLAAGICFCRWLAGALWERMSFSRFLSLESENRLLRAAKLALCLGLPLLLSPLSEKYERRYEAFFEALAA